MFVPGLLNNDGLSNSSDYFPFFFFVQLWKTTTKPRARLKIWGKVLQPCTWLTSVLNFMRIFKAVLDLKWFPRSRLSYRRRSTLFSTVFIENQHKGATSAGGTSDELFLWINFAVFTQDASLLSLPWWKKVKNDQKIDQIKGVGLRLS